MSNNAHKAIFISYARTAAAAEARALYSELGADLCFLDEEDIEVGQQFPERIMDALLHARVFVALVNRTYFSRWYCVREWRLARAAFDSLLIRHAASAELANALRHFLPSPIAWPLEEEVKMLLPPPLVTTNLVSASETARLAATVRALYAQNLPTLEERMEGIAIPLDRRQELVALAAMPPARSLSACPVYPLTLPPSLREDFIGRQNDIWRLHVLLTETQASVTGGAAQRATVHGSGGSGKSTLALEYVHRQGVLYTGGVFWIDASGEGIPLDAQLHGALSTLRPGTVSLAEYRQSNGSRLALELGRALHDRAGQGRILYVVDNFPEPPLGHAPASVEGFCPAPNDVTLLVTSRLLHPLGTGTPFHELPVLEPAGAIALLIRHVADSRALAQNEWAHVADWVGRLPLALALLNAALRHGVISPRECVDYAERESITNTLDAQMDAIRGQVPEKSLRGISQAFEVSYARLDPSAQLLAQRLAYLAPAPVPEALLRALASNKSDVAAMTGRSFITPARAHSRVSCWQMHGVLSDYVRSKVADTRLVLSECVKRVADTLDADGLENSDGQFTASLTISHAIECIRRLAHEPPQVHAFPHANCPLASDLTRLASRAEKLGARLADRRAFEASLLAYELALSLVPASDEHRIDLANQVSNFGSTLASQGELESDRTVERSIAILESALAALAAARAEDSLARTHNSIAGAYRILGERYARIDLLHSSLRHLSAALQIHTREEHPVEWAKAMNNLGLALLALGNYAADASMLTRAAASLRDALTVQTQEADRSEWAIAQSNLGNALGSLGNVLPDGDRELEESCAAYDTALSVTSKEGSPIDWAMMMNNRGVTLHIRGAKSRCVRYLERAVESFHAALEIRTRDRAPIKWVQTKVALGCVLMTWATVEQSSDRFRLAIGHFRDALEAAPQQTMDAIVATKCIERCEAEVRRLGGTC